MTSTKLNQLTSVDDVARACGIDRNFIETYATNADQRNYYNALKLSKKGKQRKGEYRVVFAAREQRLAALHRSVSMIVTNSTSFGQHVQGFLKKRSIRTNAEQHLGAKILLHADIKDFFDAITTTQVKNAFIEAGASVPIADILAKVSTIDGLLRQGTRCSPTIANLVCSDMDQAFLRLAQSNSCTYTRYADDLTFSGNEVPSDDAIRQIIENRGFQLRDGRCFRQHRGRCQFVTGLTIADTTRPRLPRRLKRQLRLTMYHIGERGLAKHFAHVGVSDTGAQKAWLNGILKYANSIEPKLVSEWQRTLDDSQNEDDVNDQPHD